MSDKGDFDKALEELLGAALAGQPIVDKAHALRKLYSDLHDLACELTKQLWYSYEESDVLDRAIAAGLLEEKGG